MKLCVVCECGVYGVCMVLVYVSVCVCVCEYTELLILKYSHLKIVHKYFYQCPYKYSNTTQSMSLVYYKVLDENLEVRMCTPFHFSMQCC